MARNHERRSYEEDGISREESENLLEGRHAVSEALKTGRELDKIYLLRSSSDEQGDKGLAGIRRMAQAAHIPVVECDRRRMDAMSVTGAHQGVIAAAPARSYAELEDIFAQAQTRGEAPLIVLCDSLSDPHNLGAIVRTAGAAGAHGVIIPRHRSVSLTAVTAKAAAGALEHVPVVRVANLPETMKTLQERGVWIFGTAAEGETALYDADFARPCAVVIGNEGVGMSRLVRERCDYIVNIPMRGEVPSLNASAAAAVVLFEAVRRRLGK